MLAAASCVAPLCAKLGGGRGLEATHGQRVCMCVCGWVCGWVCVWSSSPMLLLQAGTAVGKMLAAGDAQDKLEESQYEHDQSVKAVKKINVQGKCPTEVCTKFMKTFMPLIEHSKVRAMWDSEVAVAASSAPPVDKCPVVGGLHPLVAIPFRHRGHTCEGIGGCHADKFSAAETSPGVRHRPGSGRLAPGG